jgi:hypothetical protein
MIVMSTLFMTDILPLLTGVGGPLHTPSCGLFTNNIIPNYHTVLAGFTEPTLTGYARIVPTFIGAYQEPDGSVVLQTQLMEFPAPTDNTGQVIYGYFITDGGAPEHILFSETFPAPFSLVASPQNLVFGAQFVLRPSNNNGTATQI